MPSASPPLRWTQVAAWRASRHHLDARLPRRRMLSIVSELCGLHAQVLSSGELSLWARVDGIPPGTVRKALWTDRSLVKMWAMRGTLHLLPASEHPLWHASLSTDARHRRRRWARYLGIAEPEMGRLIATIGDALDGRVLSREELAREVARRRRSKRLGEALRESWGGILKPASYEGVLCFGPSDGQRVAFTNPRSWLRLDSPTPDPDEARRDVIRRFLKTYGPVSSQEIARWWAGLSQTAVGTMIRGMDDVTSFHVEGVEAWAFADDADAIAAVEPSRSVRLLPAFDQYVIGSTKHSADLMPGPFRDRVHRAAGWVSPVLTVDGRLEGVWRHEKRGGAVSITVSPFVRQPAWVRTAVATEAELLAGFLGGSPDLRWA